MPLFTQVVNSFVQISAAPSRTDVDGWRKAVIAVNMATDSNSILEMK